MSGLSGSIKRLVALEDAAFGIDQTWQDMSGSRAYSTTYTNTTGRPIAVRVQSGFSAGSAFVITIDGLSFLSSRVTSTQTQTYSEEFIVPDGSSYSVTCGVAIGEWLELR